MQKVIYRHWDARTTILEKIFEVCDKQSARRYDGTVSEGGKYWNLTVGPFTGKLIVTHRDIHDPGVISVVLDLVSETLLIRYEDKYVWWVEEPSPAAIAKVRLYI
jgi:hypothetical protein